jgi:C-terminal peptidase prc
MNARVWLYGVVAGLTAVLAAAAPGQAQEPERKPAGPAVVIVGAGKYEDAAIDARPTADADAKALYDLLTDPKYLGVKPDRIRLFLSAPDEKRKGEVATREAIVKAVDAAISETGKDDLLLLAFFGRGASAGDKTVYFTPNTVLKDRGKTGLVFGTDLEAAFKKLKTQNVLWMMDVVYKGFRPGEEKIAEPTLTDIDDLLYGKEDREDSVRAHDRLLLLSGFVSSDQIARGNLGLFASTTLDALKGAADTPPNNEGYEPDGLITTDELVKYLEKEMPNQAREIGKTDKEKEAQPVPIGSRTSHFPVTKNPAVTAKVQKRLDAFTALAKAGSVNEEVAKEGTALLSRMPKLKADQELRKFYQKLADGTMKLEEFVAARTELKESLKLTEAEGQTFAKKVNDAIDIVTRVYIKELNPGDLTAAAIKGMYRRIEVPLPTDIEDAIKEPKALSEDRRIALLADSRIRLGKREDLEGNKDADVAILMMLANLNDPYTVYYDKETVRKMASALRGRFPGVGIQIRRDAVHDGLLVVTPIKGSPAFAGGIQAGDLITKVIRSVDNEGNPLPPGAQTEYSTKGMKTEDAITIITGKPGTPITLVVDRDGKELTFPLKRNWVSVETVLGVHRNSDATWNFMLDPKYKVGYVRLTQFTQATFGDMRAAIEDLKREGMNGLVLDLRGDPGGYLTSATNICEYFVGPVKLVTVKPRAGSAAGRERVYRGEKKAEGNFPMVVLVNGHSASASEIVSACLQDHERAIIVGERTYGKGSVQDVISFDETGGEIKLTIARYYPPSGRNIDKLATDGKPDEEWGVKPDRGFEVKLTREEQNDLEELMRDLEIIPAKGDEAKQVTAEKDKQLKVALDQLRKTIEDRRRTGAIK